MPAMRDVLSEAAILGLFAIGWGVSTRLGRRWTGAEVAVMAAIGLLFELLTAHFWHYHHVFLLIPAPVDRPISASFAFGWAGMVMGATSLAQAAWTRWRLEGRLARHAALAGAWFALGFCAETFFYNIGVIEYTDPVAWRLVPGQFPPLPPTNFLVGYALVPPLFSWLMLWLERGLATRTAP